MVRKRSSAWAFFQEVESGSVRCLLCSDSLVRPEYGATTNMLRHLRTKHPAEFNKTKDGVQENRSTSVLPEMKTDEPRCCSEIDIVLETDGDSFSADKETGDDHHMTLKQRTSQSPPSIIRSVSEIDIVLETDEDSNTFTTENNPADGIQEVEPGGLAELSADKETSDDHHMTLKRSWIWRHFEQLDGSARCRICSKRLQACKGGSTGNLHRHMSAKHPRVFRSPQSPPSKKRSLSAMEDDDSDSFSTVRVAETNSAVNGIQEAAQGVPAEDPQTVEKQPAGRRHSWIWRHFDPLDGLAALRCRICLRTLRDNGGTSNLHRHVSKKHPLLFKTRRFHSSSKRPSSVTMEDGNSHSLTAVNEAEISPAGSSMQEAAQGVPTEDNGTFEGQPVGRRHSWIWKHFDLLDGVATARCRICLRTLQAYGGTGNLHRHVSKKHPLLFKSQQSHSSTKRPSSEVTVEDGISGSLSTANVAEINSAVNGIQETAQGLQVPAEDNQRSKGRTIGRKRSWIWRHFSLLDGLAAVRCRICSRKLQGNGGTSNLTRHLSKKHPLLFRAHQSRSSLGSTDSSSGPLEAAGRGVPGELMTHEKARDNLPVRCKRKLIWKHFELLESLEAARCRICMKKIRYLKGNSTRNLFQHMSKRHPQLHSQLVSDVSKVNADALRTSESLGETEKHLLTKEQELIESLRTAQRKEAQALEEQKKLLEGLQAESAKEAEAERQQIESLRRAQQEEAEELSRQKEELHKEKEELQKEKEELQKKWEELQQEREKNLIF